MCHIKRINFSLFFPFWISISTQQKLSFKAQTKWDLNVRGWIFFFHFGLFLQGFFLMKFLDIVEYLMSTHAWPMSTVNHAGWEETVDFNLQRKSKGHCYITGDGHFWKTQLKGIQLYTALENVEMSLEFMDIMEFMSV